MRTRQLIMRGNNEWFDEQMRPSKMTGGLMNVGVRNLNDAFGHEPIFAVVRQEDRILGTWTWPALDCHRNKGSSARLSISWDRKQSQWRIVILLSRRKTTVY